MASSSALKHWCVVDKVWPQDAAAHKNYKFLEGLGCVRETGDIFSSTLGIERCNEYSGKGVFVASNLNWRQSNREVANRAGFFDHSFGAYYELLLPVLRAKASSAHIVILANIHGFTRLYTKIHEFIRIYTTIHEYAQIAMNMHEYTRTYTNIHEYARIHTNINEYTGIQGDTREYTRIHMDIDEYT